jgi:DNA polymerase
MKPWSEEWKEKELQKLFDEWDGCQLCGLCEYRTNIVFGNGNPNADIMLVGEAPGENEDATGDVFVGESGKLLNDLLEAAEIIRKDLFIINLVMCRPPGNRDPTSKELAACAPRLHRQIYLVDPMLIICVGKLAMRTLMGGKWTSITSDKEGHGKIGEAVIQGRHQMVVYPAMPIMHPAYILREDKINKKTGNWEAGGEATKTVSDLIRARKIE